MSVMAQQLDSSKISALGGKLAEYYDALKYESIDVQKQECDFLIEAATDTLVRQFVAQDIYDHYINSPVMGAENVAVHVFDRWFADGKLKMRAPEEFAEAQVYAAFNRRSLLGEHAPELTLESFDGLPMTLYASENQGKYSILYFYDTDCSKCRLETRHLNDLLTKSDYPIAFYAIYAGDDRASWEKYISEKFKAEGVVHLWDPAFESDFQRKYGVTQTPRLLLVSPDGVIVGRGLDTQGLATMLEGLYSSDILEYGTRESEALFDGIFSMYSGRPSAEEVSRLADYIHDRTLSNGDTLMFRQMTGDYLYYLSANSGEGFKEGMRHHIDKNILSQNGVWRTSDDSLKVVGFAQIMSDLLSKAAPGTKVTPVKVPGELYTRRGHKNVTKKLSKLGGESNIIIFYTEGCDVCAAEKAAALSMLKGDDSLAGIISASDRKTLRVNSRDVTVFMVNVDKIMASDPALAARLMDSFDLSSLPYIIITDSKGVILRRYVSLCHPERSGSGVEGSF